MSLILTQLEQALAESPASLKTAQAFSKKVQSFTASAQNRKEADRMLLFCTDSLFLTACGNALERHEGIRDELGEFTPFWYLLICVLIDARHNADTLAILTRWAQARMAAEDGSALMMLHRYLDAYADSVSITPLRDQVAAAHDALLASLPVARCFELLGLRRPAAGELWLLDFSLATVATESPFQRMPDEAFTMSVSMGSLLRRGSNSQHSVNVSCAAQGGSLGSDFGDGQFRLARDGVWYEHAAIDLLNLPEHLRQIEAFYGISFQRKAFSSFRKHGLRQRDIEKRLLAWLS